MGYIFWGYLCLQISFEVTVWDKILSLPPSFIGYFLIFAGLRQMKGESVSFQKGKPLAILLIVISVLDFMGAIPMSAFTIFIKVCMVLSWILLGKILQGISDIEENHSLFLNGAVMKKLWLGEIALSIFIWLFNILRLFNAAVFMIIIRLVIQAVLVFYFYQAKQGYEKWLAQTEEGKNSI